jgi:hypothetical protein
LKAEEFKNRDIIIEAASAVPAHSTDASKQQQVHPSLTVLIVPGNTITPLIW